MIYERALLIGLYGLLFTSCIDIAIHMTMPIFYAVSGAFIPPLIKTIVEYKTKKKRK